MGTSHNRTLNSCCSWHPSFVGQFWREEAKRVSFLPHSSTTIYFRATSASILWQSSKSVVNTFGWTRCGSTPTRTAASRIAARSMIAGNPLKKRRPASKTELHEKSTEWPTRSHAWSLGSVRMAIRMCRSPMFASPRFAVHAYSRSSYYCIVEQWIREEHEGRRVIELWIKDESAALERLDERFSYRRVRDQVEQHRSRHALHSDVSTMFVGVCRGDLFQNTSLRVS